MDSMDIRLNFMILLDEFVESKKKPEDVVSYACQYEQFASDFVESLYDKLFGENDVEVAEKFLNLIDMLIRKSKKRVFSKRILKDEVLMKKSVEKFLTFSGGMLQHWRRKDVLTNDQIFPSLKPINPVMDGRTSHSDAMKMIEKDREQHKRARQQWFSYDNEIDLFEEVWESPPKEIYLPKKTTKRVYIFDLDETLILYRSFLSGEAARKFKGDIKYFKKLGQDMEYLISRVSERYLFGKQLEVDYDQTNVRDLEIYDDKRNLAYYKFDSDDLSMRKNPQLEYLNTFTLERALRWREISFQFRKKDFLRNRLNSDELKLWEETFHEINACSRGWMDRVFHMLDYRSSGPHEVVLVSSCSLTSTLAKLLLFHLKRYFLVENIYSANKHKREECFKRIQNRFGLGYEYIVVADGDQEKDLAYEFNFSFIRIEYPEDFKKV
ncbi:hypothetical protein ROZALSC1DRAFT_29740 [Rozella allomycis CSF55]|uniref:protein-tyrosine-phosphatase n=1 Tax=Rozella allomycis (strain CSF55) TaxID=988480 RepID=A0A075ATC6_ROZAC|nr:hypothetical protein O9G_000261 [Rozella allomycis CSF55]RKP18583.1 hypothetical protein ROZALSC1DRAFT_29740 [Rozella allomycis CSF55]|eukprot:EPZ31782.1 hypothetical protein O9G_000261 [Rozella allomycis CSF55]